MPQAGIDKRYFNIVMEQNVDQFMRVYATGLNIQLNEIAHFPIYLHNYETQKAVSKMMKRFDDELARNQKELQTAKDMKDYFLNNLMI